MKRLIVGVLCVLVLSGCYDDITVKPKEMASEIQYRSQLSQINAQLSINQNELESKINTLFSTPIKGGDTGEYSEQFQAKTKNIAYHPNEWFKTKDPLYNPNKWIKKCVIVCVKTKNPFYHPRQWILTKDPLYDPNQWIYADVVKINVGYKYDYKVIKSGEVSIQNYEESRFRIAIPLKLEASVGFKGELAKIGQVERKDLEAKATVFLDIDMKLNSNWCPNLKPDVNIKWSEGPKFEVAGGVWLDFNFAAKFLTPAFNKKAEDAISSLIDCQWLRSELVKIVKPSKITLSDGMKGMYLNIYPEKLYAPKFSYADGKILILLASQMYVDLSNIPIKDQVYELPQLTTIDTFENLVRLTVPVNLDYKFIQEKLNIQLDGMNSQISETIVNTNNDIIKNIKSFTIKEIDIYPSGDNVALGIKFVLKSKISPVSTKGTLYMSSQINVSENNIVSLQNIKLSSNLDNDRNRTATTSFI